MGNLGRQTGTDTEQTVETGAENKIGTAINASNSRVGVDLVELVPDHEYAIDLDLPEMMEMAQHLEMEKEMQFQPGMEFNEGFGHQVHEEGHHHVHINIDVD